MSYGAVAKLANAAVCKTAIIGSNPIRASISTLRRHYPRLVLGLVALTGVSAVGAEIPAGARIEIRLKTAVSSRQSKVGDPVEAVVISPVVLEGQIWMAPGEVLKGTVRGVLGAGPDGDPQAGLELEFGDWRGKKLTSKVTEVDNGRETVDTNGKIVGIGPSETLSARMDKGLEQLGQRAGRLAEFLQAAKGALLKKAEFDIGYEAGVELSLALTKGLPVEKPAEVQLPAVAGAEELHALVNGQPFQTMAEKPVKPSDITNLMFIGSRERLEATFQAAGWNTAAALNSASGLETFRAVVENRGYKEAPMSILLLEGQKPDLVFQKQNNTFAKRHHLRIWRRPAEFQGQTVWVCAATHDIGIEFSPENRTFIHKIDSKIDGERAKVVSDFLLTGRVKGLALVERAAVPKKGMNATGDQIETDGGMAVLVLE